MKSLAIISFIVIFLFTASACNQHTPTDKPVEAISSLKSTTTSQEQTKKLQEYVKEPIKVRPAEEVQDEWNMPYIPSKRLIYYALPGSLEDYVGNDAANKWIKAREKAREKTNEEPNEMYMVSFIKYFNIPKDEFIKVIEQDEKMYILLGNDMQLEEYETPNADIIYTFNNQIINEFYRRQ